MSFKELPLLKENKGTVLFYPFVPRSSFKEVKKVLSGRWIGQGPKVEYFEKIFKKMFCNKYNCLAVGSGTDALHLAYILAGLKKGDEVIAPVFTCTATNIPLLYMGIKIKFADIDVKTMNMSIESIESIISKKTKAIIVVHYGGLPCDMDKIQKIATKYKIPIIEDAAHALGAKYNDKKVGSISDFTIFSFQAIKHITTGDGGMLCFKDKKILNKAKRLRWFGIDREKKQKGIWENDIKEIGYKYQLNDIGAAIGIESLKQFKKLLNHRRKIFYIYLKNLSKNKNIQCIHDYNNKYFHSAWLFKIITKKKDYLQKNLRKAGIETNQVHFRNDKYSIFKKFAKNKIFKNMNQLENQYLVLPIHHKVTPRKALYICSLINSLI